MRQSCAHWDRIAWHFRRSLGLLNDVLSSQVTECVSTDAFNPVVLVVSLPFARFDFNSTCEVARRRRLR